MRIYMAWFASKHVQLDKRQLPNGCRFSRTPHEQFVFFEQSDCAYDNVKTLFHHFAQQGLKCQSIQIFEQGPLPDLTMYGFEKRSVGYSYPANNLTISACPYTKEEWCCMIRGERIIPFQTLNIVPYFQEITQQLTMFDEGGMQREKSLFTRIS